MLFYAWVDVMGESFVTQDEEEAEAACRSGCPVEVINARTEFEADTTIIELEQERAKLNGKEEP